ncbi:GTP-binding protein, rho subfamily [Flagelloscypha sp. PMI_526]|nr:GTP-binding protein, rho subfamily [Flagelloscypha sp. PMI_526]
MNASCAPTEVEVPLRKINLLVVGDEGVGKTSLLMKYATRVFPQGGAPTINDPMTVVAQSPWGEIVQVRLTDTARPDEYELHRWKSSAVLICFSVANPASLDNVLGRWIEEVRHICPGTRIVLVGCQTDLRHDLQVAEDLKLRGYQQPSSFDEGKEVSRRIGAEYVECSSLLGDGVVDVFETALKAATRTCTLSREHVGKLKCVVF